MSTTEILVSPQSTPPYPILIGENHWENLAIFLAGKKLGKKICIISHPDIYKHYGIDLESALRKYDYTLSKILVDAGEPSKSKEALFSVLDQLLDQQLERQHAIIALGGGVIGDLAGFAASIYLRGIPFIQCPTSLLAQVDAAIGGKTGINHNKGKNLIGSFYQPLCTFIALDTLSTLPKKEVRCGLAEIVKYGVIEDANLFRFIEKEQDIIKQLTPHKHMSIWRHLIERSCQNKADIVSEDEKESNKRAILNFGHTIGHALEAELNYQNLSHGEAVAIGMKAATHIAVQLELCSTDLYTQLTNLLENLGFQLTLPNLSADALLEHIQHDKKVKDGRINFILPTGIGTVKIVNNINTNVIRNSIKEISK